MAAAHPSVLVLGVVPSLTWSVVRCLRRAGHAPLVLAWHARAPLMWTGDCHRYVRWHGLRRNGAQLDTSALAQVRELCGSAGIDKVIGADYDTALLLARGAASEGVPACAVPQASTMTTLNDKWNLTRLLAASGLPAPDSVRVDDAAQLLANQLVYPIVSKPLDRWASVGFQVHRTRESLARTLAHGRLTAGFPLIAQSHVPGWDVGASFLAQRGQVAACSVFRHTRRGERTFYPSVRVREYVKRFVAVCDYSGVGHLDLRYDPARDSYFILELNPRFWASLLYAERAGLNYPELLLTLDDTLPPQPAAPRSGRVRLAPYERAMTLSTRWFGSAYERVTGARL
ncbi:ATP-grasp domain-containing protein [Pseudoduganella sp. FT25W]|uniref:ATP-grasp domain-containing protein n=1 Tax=Duganella alba TaxID=2666081 RepID=A0A6L5QLM8_9BURK|nr:ATP-grasp domain-containing protein [Duganella alba]MRX10577.1 ATP-grasp domain-containing protein [Duganella alba]MRX15804.1 ATP-grasp domain-containing protein [Duganella alba]